MLTANAARPTVKPDVATRPNRAAEVAAAGGLTISVGTQRAYRFSLSASEVLDRIAALIPPPRKYRHRYFGVLAPNSPWRALVTAQAGRLLTAGSKAPRPKPLREVAGTTRTGQGARYVWAQLIARIYGVFALQCSRCGGRVYLVGLITEPSPARQILEHVGERTTAPVIAPARSPPLGDE